MGRPRSPHFIFGGLAEQRISESLPACNWPRSFIVFLVAAFGVDAFGTTVLSRVDSIHRAAFR
jgi:hypothetical protein